MHYRKDIAKRGLSRPIRLGVLGSTRFPHIWVYCFRQLILSCTMPCGINICFSNAARGTDLTAIIDAINAQTLNAQVCIVISNRSQSGILTKAQANGIPHKYVSATGLSRECYDQILSNHLLDEGAYQLLSHALKNA